MGIGRAWIAGAIWGLCSVVRADDVLTRVEAWLSAGIEPAGVHEQIVALGGAGEDALWTLYGDAKKSRVVRLRALNELGSFSTPRTAEGLTAIVRAAQKDTFARSPLVLRRALDGLSTIAETRALTLEANELTFVANHPDAHVRKAAAKLLAAVDRGDVQGTLSTLATRDPSRMVRASAQRSQSVRAARARH